MLCNRPFAGASGAAAKQSSGKTSGSFKCGTVETPLGENVKISEHQRMVAKMSKKDSVLSKHKKWLADLQKTKEKLQEEYLDEAEKKEEKKEKFMAREAKMRAIVRGTIGPTKHRQEELALLEKTKEIKEGEGGEEKKEAEGKGRVPALNIAAAKDDADKPSGGGRMGIEAKKNAPAWALTESEAKEVEDFMEEEEEEELLDFASGLDFEKYADDLEVKVLIDQIKERVDILESEKLQDDKALRDLINSELEKARAAERMASGEAEADYKHADEDEASEADIFKEIAMSAREKEGMGEVHSVKSLQALVSSRADKLASDAGGGLGTALSPPKIVTHKVDGGSRLNEKDNIAKLPYLNRNPAV